MSREGCGWSERGLCPGAGEKGRLELQHVGDSLNAVTDYSACVWPGGCALGWSVVLRTGCPLHP